MSDLTFEQLREICGDEYVEFLTPESQQIIEKFHKEQAEKAQEGPAQKVPRRVVIEDFDAPDISTDTNFINPNRIRPDTVVVEPMLDITVRHRELLRQNEIRKLNILAEKKVKEEKVQINNPIVEKSFQAQYDDELGYKAYLLKRAEEARAVGNFVRAGDLEVIASNLEDKIILLRFHAEEELKQEQIRASAELARRLEAENVPVNQTRVQLNTVKSNDGDLAFRLQQQEIQRQRDHELALQLQYQ